MEVGGLSKVFEIANDHGRLDTFRYVYLISLWHVSQATISSWALISKMAGGPGVTGA